MQTLKYLGNKNHMCATGGKQNQIYLPDAWMHYLVLKKKDKMLTPFYSLHEHKSNTGKLESHRAVFKTYIVLL